MLSISLLTLLPIFFISKEGENTFSKLPDQQYTAFPTRAIIIYIKAVGKGLIENTNMYR